jgi:hypothetical protein
MNEDDSHAVLYCSMAWQQGDLQICPPSRSQLQALKDLQELGGSADIKLQHVQTAAFLSPPSSSPQVLGELQNGQGIRILDGRLCQGAKTEFRVPVVKGTLSRFLQVYTVLTP